MVRNNDIRKRSIYSLSIDSLYYSESKMYVCLSGLTNERVIVSGLKNKLRRPNRLTNERVD